MNRLFRLVVLVLVIVVFKIYYRALPYDEIAISLNTMETCDEIKQKSVTFLPLCHRSRPDPVEPWAFIRVKEEIKTIEASLNSLLPAIKRGVIGYTNSTDGTIEVIKRFCKQNPGFIAFNYPYEVYPQCDKHYYTGNYRPENTLEALYNATFQKIPMGDWLIKIDADQIYDSDKLQMMKYLPKHDDCRISIGRINLHVDNGKLMIVQNGVGPYSYEHKDQWLIKKSPKMQFGMAISANQYAWETMTVLGAEEIITSCVSWHLPYNKKWRNLDHLVKYPFATDGRRLLQRYINERLITEDMLDENKISEILFKYRDRHEF